MPWNRVRRLRREDLDAVCGGDDFEGSGEPTFDSEPTFDAPAAEPDFSDVPQGDVQEYTADEHQQQADYNQSTLDGFDDSTSPPADYSDPFFDEAQPEQVIYGEGATDPFTGEGAIVPLPISELLPSSPTAPSLERWPASDDGFVFRGEGSIDPFNFRVFENGFQAKGSLDNFYAHVVDGNSNHTNFVSTSQERSIAERFAAGWGDDRPGWVYRINKEGGIDVPEVLGSDNPYPDREVLFRGGIPGDKIEGAYRVWNGQVTDYVPNPRYAGPTSAPESPSNGVVFGEGSLRAVASGARGGALFAAGDVALDYAARQGVTGAQTAQEILHSPYAANVFAFAAPATTLATMGARSALDRAFGVSTPGSFGDYAKTIASGAAGGLAFPIDFIPVSRFVTTPLAVGAVNLL